MALCSDLCWSAWLHIDFQLGSLIEIGDVLCVWWSLFCWAMFWKCFCYSVDFKHLFPVICKLILTVYIFFWMEVLYILKISLVVMHIFIQEIINKISSGFVGYEYTLLLQLCKANLGNVCAFILSQERKVTCYQTKIPSKNLVEDLILEMTVSPTYKQKN